MGALRKISHSACRQANLARNFASSRLSRASRINLSSPVFSSCIALLALVALAACMVLSCSSAWADDSQTREDNTVNARQTADNSFLYDTSIFELANANASMQGNTVQVTGEVVGESFMAEEDPGKCWITLEAIEEEYESSISVLVDKSVLELIDTYGSYGKVGTILRVRGTFNLACTSHEGITDIHADNVVLVARGVTSYEPFVIERFIPGIVSVSLGLLLVIIYGFLRERER